eukprot:COSAG06_NODE_1896_length_8121_cov_3.278733_11_plen_165_part_00
MPAKNAPLFLSFPYVCPEPVLIKCSFYIQMAQKVAFFAPIVTCEWHVPAPAATPSPPSKQTVRSTIPSWTVGYALRKRLFSGPACPEPVLADARVFSYMYEWRPKRRLFPHRRPGSLQSCVGPVSVPCLCNSTHHPKTPLRFVACPQPVLVKLTVSSLVLSLSW